MNKTKDWSPHTNYHMAYDYALDTPNLSESSLSVMSLGDKHQLGRGGYTHMRRCTSVLALVNTWAAEQDLLVVPKGCWRKFAAPHRQWRSWQQSMVAQSLDASPPFVLCYSMSNWTLEWWRAKNWLTDGRQTTRSIQALENIRTLNILC